VAPVKLSRRSLGQIDTDAAQAMARCRREIAAVEAQILAGHSDIQGLCRALADWSTELKILESEQA